MRLYRRNDVVMTTRTKRRNQRDGISLWSQSSRNFASSAGPRVFRHRPAVF